MLNGELQLATLLIKVILNNIEEKATVQTDMHFTKSIAKELGCDCMIRLDSL